MKIDKAIEILDLTIAHTRADNTPGVRDAIKLGLEAMKVIREFRAGTYNDTIETLPGEEE